MVRDGARTGEQCLRIAAGTWSLPAALRTSMLESSLAISCTLAGANSSRHSFFVGPNGAERRSGLVGSDTTPLNWSLSCETLTAGGTEDLLRPLR